MAEQNTPEQQTAPEQNATPAQTATAERKKTLDEIDRLRISEAELKITLAAYQLREAQEFLAGARAARDEVATRIREGYGLGSADSVNPETGAITRRSAAA